MFSDQRRVVAMILEWRRAVEVIFLPEEHCCCDFDQRRAVAVF